MRCAFYGSSMLRRKTGIYFSFMRETLSMRVLEGSAVGRMILMAQWRAVRLRLLLPLVHPGGAQHGWVRTLIAYQGWLDPGSSPHHDFLWHRYPPPHL